MFIVSQLLWGLVCIHLFWLYFFITGTLVRPKQQQPASDCDDNRTGPCVMSDLVITSVTGIAITGFVVFILGFIGLLNASAFGLWLVIEGLLFKVGRNENVFKADFWVVRFKLIKRAWDLPAIIIYCVFLMISVPAILPPIAFDATSYHLAYAVDWANAGHIYADPFLRNPYYANNFLLLYALLFCLKLGPLCHFLTWFSGLMTGLGVYSLITCGQVRMPDQSTSPARQHVVRALVVTLGLALSPIFLRWVNTGFLDVSIGLFLFIPILCTYIALLGTERTYDFEFVLVAAFCAGMKISHFLFLPLFIASITAVLAKRRTPLSRTFRLVCLLLILSAPWYIRNFIRTGDPFTPTLNILFHGRDPFWSHEDYTLQLTDLTTAKDARSLLSIPIDVVWDTTSKNFREYGTSPILMLLYVPLIMAGLLFFGGVRRRFGWPFVYLNGALIYLIGYWVGISSFARYFLLLFPVYAAYTCVWLNTLLSGWVVNWRARPLRYAASLLVTASLVVLVFFPSPMARVYYEDVVQNNYLGVANRYTGYRSYLRQNLPGYASTQYIIAHHSDPNEKVMLIGFENLAYYFRKNRIVSFGDWFGIGRHSDLIYSINHGDLSSYLTKFNVGAVLVNRSPPRMDDETYRRFVQQLEENHFALQPAQEPGADIYIKAK